MIEIKRIYNGIVSDNSYCVLIDRFWPRGFKKEDAFWNEWMRDAAPSKELIKWFSHDPSKWEEFRERYMEELSHKPEELHKLKELETKHGNLTLLYSARDEEHNNAVALKEILGESV
jgi:uncharacterized protein YeaO (DUF488 family)